MKKILLLLLLFSLGFQLYAQKVTTGRQTVVVLPGNTAQHPQQTTRVVNLTVELMEKLGRFEVLDRRTTDQTLAEIKLKLEGFLDENAVIEIGNLMSSDIGMVVDLTSFSVEKNRDIKAAQDKTSSEVVVTTRYDAVIEVSLRQFDINTSKALKTISVRGTGEGDSGVDAEGSAFSSLRSQLFESLKGFYPLLLTVKEKGSRHVVISGGKDLGIYRGMKFDVYDDLKAYQRCGLVIVERADDNTAVAKILKGFSAIGEGNYLREKINAFPETAVSLNFSKGYFADDIMAVDLCAEFNTFNTLGGGINLMLSLGDADADFFRGNLFGIFKPLLADMYDLGIRGGIGITHLFGGEDEEGHSVMSQEFQLTGGLAGNIYFSRKLALFAAWDYYFYLFRINDWYYMSGSGDDGTKHDAAGSVDGLDLEGGYATIGMKYIF